MAAKSADSQTVQEIRRLAVDPSLVQITRTAEYDLMARNLGKADVCDEIVNWIDAGERVKPTTLHGFPGLVGQPAYEMKPRIQGTLFYVKVALVELGEPDEYMLLISAHPDR